MDPAVIARQVLLFAHLLAFALALAEVARGDWRMLGGDFSADGLRAATRLVSWALWALWATGIGLLIIEFGTDFAAMVGRPKVLTKLIVATALTVNGILLHRLAFPALHGKVDRPDRAVALCCVLGAISTATWLYAAFVGAARFVAPYFTLGMFLGLYALILGAALLTAFVLVRPACSASLPRPPLSGFLPPPAVRAASPSSALPILHPPTCLPGLIRSAGRIAPPSPSSASIFK